MKQKIQGTRQHLEGWRYHDFVYSVAFCIMNLCSYIAYLNEFTLTNQLKSQSSLSLTFLGDSDTSKCALIISLPWLCPIRALMGILHLNISDPILILSILKPPVKGTTPFYFLLHFTFEPVAGRNKFALQR